MNSGELSWSERLLASLGVLIAMIATYWKYWRHRPPTVIIDNQQQAEPQQLVSKEIQVKREEFVSEVIQQQIPELVQEVKENSKDAQAAAAALENSQL